MISWKHGSYIRFLQITKTMLKDYWMQFLITTLSTLQMTKSWLLEKPYISSLSSNQGPHSFLDLPVQKFASKYLIFTYEDKNFNKYLIKIPNFWVILNKMWVPTDRVDLKHEKFLLLWFLILFLSKITFFGIYQVLNSKFMNN